MDDTVVKKLNHFFKHYKLLEYKKGEVLIEPETNPPGLFYLKEGVVKQYAISEKGEEQVVNIFKAPALFPISWIINDSTNTHYFEALANSLVGSAPKAAALVFLKNEPLVLFDLLQRIYRGLDGFFLRMENLMHGNARNRLIVELIIHAKRFGEKIDNKIIIKTKLTERELGARIGLTRETVSRQIQKLKKDKLITFKKGELIINDLPNLEKILHKTS